MGDETKIEPRTLESLTRLERRWLREGFCGWCGSLGTARRCGSFKDPCNIDELRAHWLQSYKPRNPL